MCGRFSMISPEELIQRIFRINRAELPPRFNVAPSQKIPAVCMKNEERKLVFLRWGLVPSWADDPAIGNRLINAKSETAFEKTAFRQPMRHRRCLILADGFYEWKRVGKSKQPYFIFMKDHSPFAFAGLWELWKNETESIQSCTILTTEANSLIQPIHDRMPVIVSPENYESWLTTPPQDTETVKALLAPYPPEAMNRYSVGPWVNNPHNDVPDCMKPIPEKEQEGFLF